MMTELAKSRILNSIFYELLFNIKTKELISYAIKPEDPNILFLKYNLDDTLKETYHYTGSNTFKSVEAETLKEDNYTRIEGNFQCETSVKYIKNKTIEYFAQKHPVKLELLPYSKSILEIVQENNLDISKMVEVINVVKDDGNPYIYFILQN